MSADFIVPVDESGQVVGPAEGCVLVQSLSNPSLRPPKAAKTSTTLRQQRILKIASKTTTLFLRVKCVKVEGVLDLARLQTNLDAVSSPFNLRI